MLERLLSSAPFDEGRHPFQHLVARSYGYCTVAVKLSRNNQTCDTACRSWCLARGGDAVVLFRTGYNGAYETQPGILAPSGCRHALWCDALLRPNGSVANSPHGLE